MNILSEMMFFVMGKVPKRIVIEIVLARFITAIVCVLMIFESKNFTTKSSFDFIKNGEYFLTKAWQWFNCLCILILNCRIMNNVHILIYSLIFWVYLKVPPGGEYAKQRVLGSSCLSIIESIVAVPAPSEWPTQTRSKFWVPLSVSLLKARVKRCSSFNFL